jgi:Ser/Thr protein kinase RdoA (MazF antagonist)
MADSLISNKYHHDLQFNVKRDRLTDFVRMYGLEPTKIEAIKTGHENSSFVVTAKDGEYVLRIYRQARKPVAKIYEEVQLSRYLLDAGLPVPVILDNQYGRPITDLIFDDKLWHGILMERLKGSPVKSYRPKLLEGMATLHARSHQLGIAYGAEQSVHFGVMRRGWAGSLLPRGYGHFDYQGSNILAVGNSVTGLIDFDDMHYAVIVRCLIHTLVMIYRSGGTVADIRRYLTEYETGRSLTIGEKAIIMVYLTMRHHYAWALRLLSARVRRLPQRLRYRAS